MEKNLKKTLVILTAFFLFVVQTSLGETIDIFGVVPNLILVFAVAYSLDSSAFSAALAGCICGLLTDFSDNGIVGIGGFFMMCICFCASIVSKKFYYDNKLSGLIIVFVSGLLFELSKVFIVNLIYTEFSLTSVFFRFILPGAVYNSCLSLPLMWWINWLKNEYVRGI